MWTIIFLGIAALLWLMELSLGPQGMAVEGSLHALDHVALGFATLAAAQLLLTLTFPFIRGSSPSRQAARTDLLRTLIAAVVYLGAFFLFFHFGLGLDITALLATSAALSLVIGLALQATLGNLFAGISIELEHAVRLGDYVRRGALAGRVISLGWRSIHIQSDSGSVLVMPNSIVTSDVLEVLPEAEPYRHEIEFVVSSQYAPGLVIKLTTRVLRSGISGLSEAYGCDVVMRDVQPDNGLFRYVARFHVASVSDRALVGSAVLERVWYELARLEKNGAAVEPGEEASRHRANFWWPVFRLALSGEPPDLESELMKTAQIRRYARHERYQEHGVSLIVDGSLSAIRSLADAGSELRTVLSQLTSVDTDESRAHLDYDSFQKLKKLGVNYVGPMTGQLCERIAAKADDPWTAYQAFASFIPDDGARAEFLAHAPRESLRMMRPGAWLGLESRSPFNVSGHYEVRQNSILLAWDTQDFGAALNACADQASSNLMRCFRDRKSLPSQDRVDEF